MLYLVEELEDGSIVIHGAASDVEKLRDMVPDVLHRQAQDRPGKMVFMTIATADVLSARHGPAWTAALAQWTADNQPGGVHPHLRPGVA